VCKCSCECLVSGWEKRVKIKYKIFIFKQKGEIIIFRRD